MAISIKRKGKNRRPYAYYQTSKRVGGKVKTPSQYLGPVDAIGGGARLGLKLLYDQQTRDTVFKPFEQMLDEKDARAALRAAADNAPVIIGDPQVGKEWTQEMFDNEAMSQKSDAVSVVMQSSSESEQLSDQVSEAAPDQGIESPAE
jgi:hypothetical protein